MQNKKLFEFTCQCAIYKNEIKVSFKGEKGKIRKVVIFQVEQYPHQQAPALSIKLKQPTIDQLFSRQNQQANNQQPKEKILPLSIKGVVYIYCNGDELFQFEIDQIRNLQQVNLQQKCMSLLHADGRRINFFDCPIETLQNAKQICLDLQQKIRSFQNKKQPKQDEFVIKQHNFENQNEQNEQNKDNQIQQEKQLTQMQKAKLQRRKMNETKEELNVNKSQKLNTNKDTNQITDQVRKQNCSQLPNQLLLIVLKFFEMKSLFKLRVINSQFHTQINRLIIRLSYKPFIEIPFEVMIRSITKFTNLQSLSFGQMRNIKISQIGDQVLPNLNNLIQLDIGDYIYLNDKVACKLISQYDSIRILKLPYNSKISNITIQLINQRLSYMHSVKFIDRDKNSVNDNISHQSLVSLIQNRSLQYFGIPNVNIEFFEHYKDQYEKELLINSIKGKFKVRNINFQVLHQRQIDAFNKFLDTTQLIKLRLSSFQSKNQQLKYTALFDNMTFKLLSQIKHLSLGSFVEDSFCKELSKQENIEILTLKIRSKQISDEGLKYIVEKFKKLESINIALCSMINGHGFDYLEDHSLTLDFPKIKITVSFDEFQIACLEELLQNKSYEYQINNIQIRKK